MKGHRNSKTAKENQDIENVRNKPQEHQQQYGPFNIKAMKENTKMSEQKGTRW